MVKRFIKEFVEIPNQIINYVSLKKHSVIYGDNLIIRGKILLYGDNIRIGNNVRIKSGIKYNPIGGDSVSIIVCKKGASVTIGNGVGISNSTIVAHESVSIGNNVMIGGSVKIYDTDFHSLDYEKRISGFDGIKTAPVEIGDGVFIGAHTVILKGVKIGARSIVGAGSVVTKSIPEEEIWAGNPAHFISHINPK